MAKWDYIITSGKELRKAIDNGDIQATLKALQLCSQELLDKLSDEDREWKGMDIEDAIATLDYTYTDDIEEVDGYLEEFYDLCDSLRAWVEI